jgi:hypothetical protein
MCEKSEQICEGQGHTPGPWRAEHQPFGSAIYVGGGKTIATAHGSAAITKEELPHAENARLIAAAPDLLSALNAILPSYRTQVEKHGGFDWEHEWLAQASEAVAKAEGRS